SGEAAVSVAYCCGVQEPSPAASEGLMVNPSGSVTTASRACAGTFPFGSVSASSFGVRVKSKPLGEEARGLVTCAVTTGSKCKPSQPLRLVAAPVASRLSALAVATNGCCHELAVATNLNGSSQEAG